MTRIVIVGAGYAGMHAARAARDAGADVVLVDPDGHHDLLPRLATVASGASPIGDAWAEVTDLLRGVEVVRERVVGIDRATREVALASGEVLTCDALVLTTGATAQTGDEDGLPLRTAADALRIRAALEGAERLIVVGAGATGVQLAGSAASTRPSLDVHLFERDPRVLPDAPRSLSRRAAAILRRRGVVTHLSTEVEVLEHGIRFEDGERLDGVVVWAIGWEARGSDLLVGAPTIDGRLALDRFLRLASSDSIFAAGDVARHRDVFGRPLGMSAQIALQAGKAAGSNAVRAARGEALRPVRLFELGRVVDLGGGRGVATVGPLRFDAPVTDRLVPLLHGAVDVRHLYELGGLMAVLDHAPGRHEPTAAACRRAERPDLRAVV